MNRKMYFKLMVILVISVVYAQEYQDLKVEYLEKLILAATEKANTFPPRTDNSDFFQNITNDDVNDFGEFDFIVVGGGSSGSVVATRLSEVEKWTTLLLEAGETNDDLTNIPYFFDLFALSDRNWGYTTTSQKNGCLGRNHSQCPYIRGKVLGGSGSTNGLVYSRANAADFDRWAALGNPGWAYEEVLPIFKKMENYQSKTLDRDYRGVFGPLNCAYTEPLSKFYDTFVQSNLELGIPFVADYNAANQLGVSRVQRNIEFGRRVSGATNYIEPASTRVNFNVTTKAFVTKILIHENNKTAYGVQFVKNDKYYIATARKEVIINGGSINTPQLLMLSGIGPRKDLTKHGIPVLQNSPVGQFMKDHVDFNNFYFRTNYSERIKSLSELLGEYLEGKGLLTNQLNTQTVTFFNIQNRSATFPNVEVVISAPLPQERYPKGLSNFNSQIQESLKRLKASSQWSISVFLLHPKSTGILTLKSKCPIDFPLIDSRIFSNEDDLETIYKAVELVVKLTQTRAAKRYNPKLFFGIPACSKFVFASKQFWKCLIRQMSFPAYHISGTARMGPPDHPLSVVGSDLKVHGIKQLRVADCSVIPVTISGHMNAQAFLIGEKAADLIKNYHLTTSQ